MEQDFENVPLQELISHKNWKARLLAIDKLKLLVNNNTITDFFDTLKKLTGDGVVLVQEKALELIIETFPFLGANVKRSRQLLFTTLFEKGCCSQKASVQNKGILFNNDCH
jgi:cytoskeleton-associated protein 5